MPWTHGTASTYNNARCRCEECTAAATAARDTWVKSLANRPASDIPHGKIGGYITWGCRCFKCAHVHAVYHRNHWFIYAKNYYFTDDPHYAIKAHFYRGRADYYELFVAGVPRKRFKRLHLAKRYVLDNFVVGRGLPPSAESDPSDL